MLDQTDRRIVQLLQADGRRSNVDMARELGLSESTSASGDGGWLTRTAHRSSVSRNPARPFIPHQALILLTVDSVRLNARRGLLSEMPEVVSVDWLTGEHDLAVRAYLRRNAQSEPAVSTPA